MASAARGIVPRWKLTYFGHSRSQYPLVAVGTLRLRPARMVPCDTCATVRFFNTEGPIRPERHCNIPPLDRLDLDDVLALVQEERYFVLHAPRQSG